MGVKFIIATKNSKKLLEITRILEPLYIDAVTEQDLGINLLDVEETGDTFSENAFLKASSACKATGMPALADDSGLCVDALNGAPGVYSARFAGENASDVQKIEKLLELLKDVPLEKRSAYFISTICVVLPNGNVFYAHGKCEGYIGFKAKGEGGFGYDPIFFVGNHSFAAISKHQKDIISHRGKSLRRLTEELPKFLKENEINANK